MICHAHLILTYDYYTPAEQNGDYSNAVRTLYIDLDPTVACETGFPFVGSF
jgi:hypothetical protein